MQSPLRQAYWFAILSGKDSAATTCFLGARLAYALGASTVSLSNTIASSALCCVVSDGAFYLVNDIGHVLGARFHLFAP